MLCVNVTQRLIIKPINIKYICPIPCLDILCHENKLSVNILHKNCKFCGTIIPYYTGEVKVNKNVQMRRFFCLGLAMRKRHNLRLCRQALPLLTKPLIIISKLKQIHPNLKSPVEILKSWHV